MFGLRKCFLFSFLIFILWKIFSFSSFHHLEKHVCWFSFHFYFYFLIFFNNFFPLITLKNLSNAIRSTALVGRNCKFECTITLLPLTVTSFEERECMMQMKRSKKFRKCHCTISVNAENDFFSFSEFSKILNLFSKIENENI